MATWTDLWPFIVDAELGHPLFAIDPESAKNRRLKQKQTTTMIHERYTR